MPLPKTLWVKLRCKIIIGHIYQQLFFKEWENYRFFPKTYLLVHACTCFLILKQCRIRGTLLLSKIKISIKKVTEIKTNYTFDLLSRGALLWKGGLVEPLVGVGLYMVLGQNGSGQNGTDKMAWTKWNTDKMVLDKMAWTKWYGQNGRDKTVPMKSSINLLIPLPLRIWFFHQSRFHFIIFRFPLFAYNLFVTFGY